MAAFRFRLAALRKLRQANRDELRAKLAEAYQAVQMLDQQIQIISNEIAALQQQQRNIMRGAVADVNELLETQRYQTTLRAQQSTMQNQVALLDAEVERRRQAVVEADRQVKILDKLYERQHCEHRQQRQRVEAMEMDEIAGRRGKGKG